MEITNKNAAKIYKDTAIKSANAGQIVVMLYEEMDKHLKEAIKLLATSNYRVYDQVNNHITRTQKIITELTIALTKNGDEELYNNLLNLYLYFNKQLSEANLQKDPALITPVHNMIVELMESWKEAYSKSATNTPLKKTGINLSG